MVEEKGKRIGIPPLACGWGTEGNIRRYSSAASQPQVGGVIDLARNRTQEPIEPISTEVPELEQLPLRY